MFLEITEIIILLLNYLKLEKLRRFICSDLFRFITKTDVCSGTSPLLRYTRVYTKLICDKRQKYTRFIYTLTHIYFG